MQIQETDLLGLRNDANDIIQGLARLPERKPYRRLIRKWETTRDLLPEPKDTRPIAGVPGAVFVKHKTMRKVQKRWDRDSLLMYNTVRNLEDGAILLEGSKLSVISLDRYMWLEDYMIKEIYRQMDDNDPELDELWEEQRREEGI